MPVDRKQIKELLGTGLSPEVVASAVGCEASYVSQLLSDEGFANEVSTLRTIALTSHSRRDASIDSIEDKLLLELDEMVASKAFYKPRDVLHAVQVVNAMKRRGHVAQHTGGVVNNIVHISLPPSAVRRFTTNRVNEVIDIDGQTVVTMPSHQLLKDLAARGEEGNERYKDAAKYLPSGLTTKIVGDL